MTKMVKTKDRPSKKTFKLKVENIDEEFENESEHNNRANSKNVGLPQINEFYKKFKDIDRRMQKNQHKHNSHIAYMSQAKALPIVPLPSGLANHKGRNGEINLYNQSIGNLQAQAIGTAIKHSKAEKLSFQNNRLTNKGALSILSNLNENITEINLSDNALEDYENKQAETMHRIRQSIEYDARKENQYNLKYFLSPLQIKKIQEERELALKPKEDKKKGKKKGAKTIESKESTIDEDS